MKKRLHVAVFAVIIIFVTVGLAQAQMVDYNRRARRQRGDILHLRNRTADDLTNANRKYWAELKNTKPRVSTKAEQLYDLNQDGYLQPNEMVRFLNDVTSSVEKNGKFNVSSEVLKGFDANKDGVITLNEAQAIKNSLD